MTQMVDPVFSALATKPPGKALRQEARLKLLAGLNYSIGSAIREFGDADAFDRVFLPAAYQVGQTAGAGYVRDFRIQGKNAISSGAPMLIAAETYEARYRVPMASRTRFELEVVRCPLRERAAEIGAEQEKACCSACGEYFKGLVHAVNAEAQFEMPQRMGWGNPTCTAEVALKSQRPGPDALAVPDEVRFMTASTKKDRLGDVQLQMLTRLAALAMEAFPRELSARMLAYSVRLVGLRDGRRAREVFEITGRDLETAGRTANVLNDMHGMDYQFLASDPDHYAWRALSCPYVDLRQLPRGGRTADFVCVMCRQYHDGVLQVASEEYVMDITKSLAAGDPYCEFHVRRTPRHRQIRRPLRGWLDFGVSRVAIFASDSIYHYLSKLLGETLEPVGRRAAAEFVQAGVRLRGFAKDEEGFRRVVDAVTDGGYGNFTVQSVDFAGPRAEVVCTNGFEAHAAARHGEGGRPVCHLTRGLLAGILEEMTGLSGLTATESQCRARGDEACRFVLGRRTAA